MRLFLTGMIVALALFSCATVRLSDVKIAEMKVALFEGKSQVTGVIPGKTYRVIVVIRDEKNEMIDNPNYQDIMAISPDGTFIKMWTADDQTMFAQVNPESFSLLDTPCKLVLNINNNPFPQQTVSWQVDWKNYKVVDFSGEAGSDGESGENDLDKAENAMSCCAGCLGLIAAIAGRDTPAGSSSDSKPIAGRDGVSGGNGSSGKNGETVSLDVAYYRYQDMTGMVIFEKKTRRLFFVPSFPVIINAGGGKGGKGGVGTDGTNGGNGGRGGDAGDGGDGGEVRINYLKNSRILDEVMISVNAGKGGKGGEKGLGGIGLSGGRGGIDGRNGTDGRDGRSGQVHENTVQSPEELFRGVDHRLFKKENLVWTLEVKGKE